MNIYQLVMYCLIAQTAYSATNNNQALPTYEDYIRSNSLHIVDNIQLPHAHHHPVLLTNRGCNDQLTTQVKRVVSFAPDIASKLDKPHTVAKKPTFVPEATTTKEAPASAIAPLDRATASRLYTHVITNNIKDLTDEEKKLLPLFRSNQSGQHGGVTIAHQVTDPSQLQALLPYAPDILSCTCIAGETPLHAYAKKTASGFLDVALPHLKTTQSPQEFHRIINLKNKQGETPFFLAASACKWETLKTLIAYGAQEEKNNHKKSLYDIWKSREASAPNGKESYEKTLRKYNKCLAIAPSTPETCRFTPENIPTFNDLPKAAQKAHLQDLLNRLSQ